MPGDFAPGQSILTPEQQEEVIRRSFGMQEEDPVEQEEEQDETVVQISKEEYDRLIALEQAGRSEVEPEVKVETEEVVDPLSEIDRLFSFLKPESEKEKEQEPVKVETEKVEQKPIDVDAIVAEVTRLQDETKNYYSRIGQIAESKYGMKPQEATDIVLSLTEEQLAEIAYVFKNVSLNDKAAAMTKKKEVEIPKTVISRPDVRENKVSQPQEYVSQRSPFTV